MITQIRCSVCGWMDSKPDEHGYEARLESLKRIRAVPLKSDEPVCPFCMNAVTLAVQDVLAKRHKDAMAKERGTVADE